jgi:type III pantothenate kinase
VVPAATVLWRAELARVIGAPVLEVGPGLDLGFRLGSYPRPATIGPDRLADAAAAVWRHGAPVVTVNCGTATVVNVVDGRGIFLGGMILPGAPLFLEYLAARTALLPALRWRPMPRRLPGAGRSTEAAMRLGAAVGFAGMVEAAVAHARRALGRPGAPVRLAGGYADRLAGRLGPNVHADADMTLAGLWRIHMLNPDSGGA